MKNTADNALESVSDIGVKHSDNDCLRTADGEKAGDSPNTSYAEEQIGEANPVATEDGLHTEIQSDEQLEAEFEELIRTRYKNAYHKRTEGLIRKRLRSLKKEAQSEKHAEEAAEVSEAQETTVPQNGEKIKLQLEKNKTRPSENGVGTSVGIYSRANVSKLTAKDIREILKRADRGEKIRFS